MQKEIVDAIITNSWKLLDESLQSITMQHEASSLMTDILRLAMQNDRLEMVEKLLGFQEVETVLKNRVLVFNWAAKNGYLNLVQRLLQSAEIRQCTEIQDNLALRLALENGHVAVVDTLLDVPAVRDSLDKHANWVMQLAIENHYELIIRRLLTFPAVKARLRSDRTWFLRLARNKYPELASELAAILEGQENPNLKLNNDNDLELVMQHNPREMGEETLEFEVLREEFRSDYDCNLLLAWAAAGGYLEVVRQLLQIPVIKAQAGAGSNFVLNCALLHKRFDVAKTLLEVSDSANPCTYVLIIASCTMICSQQDAIVRQLLVLPNVKSNMSTRDHKLYSHNICAQHQERSV